MFEFITSRVQLFFRISVVCIVLVSTIATSAQDQQANKSLLPEGISIYQAGGDLVCQLDAAGNLLSQVRLPEYCGRLTALKKGGLAVSLPGDKRDRVVRIDEAGNIHTIYENQQLMTNLVGVVANQETGDLLIACTDHDRLMVLPAKASEKSYGVIDLKENDHRDDLWLAWDEDGYILMSYSKPQGVYRFKPKPKWMLTGEQHHKVLGKSVYDGRRDKSASNVPIAADPTSSRWVCVAQNELIVYKGRREEFRLAYPKDRWGSSYCAAAFGPKGTLCVTLNNTPNPTFVTEGWIGYTYLVDLESRKFVQLFERQGWSMTIGPTLDWPKKHVAGDDRHEDSKK